MEKLGLVLCGGGARGAFQVGVWEELDKLGITKQITGFSGTSIGAVNTALFLSDTTMKQKEDIWLSFKQEDMLYPNINLIGKNIILKQLFKEWNLYAAILALLTGGVFTQKKLDKLLSGLSINEKRMGDCDVFTSVTDMSIGHIHTAFIDWKTIPSEKIKRYVRYSAKLPIINGVHISQKRPGHFIVDGGLRDFHHLLKKNLSNTPIAPLYYKGYRKFIVVYLSNEKDFERQIQIENNWFKGAQFCRIFYPKKSDLGRILKINKGLTKGRIMEGRKAVNEMVKMSSDNQLPFQESEKGQNDITISKTKQCIQRGEKIVNGKVQYYT